MKQNIPIFIICTILLIWVGPALGCLSNTINIGILNTDKSRLLAELISQTINERTGTNVKLLIYDSIEEFNEALTITNREYRIDLLIENPEKFKQTADSKKITILKTAKDGESFGKNDPVSFIQTPLVIGSYDAGFPESTVFYRSDLLKDYPLLPRLLTKLSRTLGFISYERLLQFVEEGEKPRNVARDFLKKKKLI
ncbi:MAG: hypothetical protein JSV73_03970 [Flavobacteriaceae bacterium]|nr:MAG: hypothetical protein JSV73_03970 [Flavobacteriaceae bacterium]